MKGRILVVEDSATQAEALRALLEQQQYEVVVARSGEAALECVAAEAFDLVLSDVVMPGIAGYELCRRLKQDPRSRHLPVVLLTSLTDPMDIVQGLESGADNYITKPYDPDHLLARVRNVLDNRRLRSASKTSLGVTVRFLGRDLTITSEKEQILDLFISSVEDVVRTNEALQRSQRELANAHAQLEAYAQEQAREARISTVRYHALLQNAGDAIFVVDPQGRVLEANRGAADLVGCSAKELVNQRLETLLPVEEQKEFRSRFARLTTDRQVQLGEYCFQGGTGCVVWCDLTASLTQLNGEALVLVIARDVTERRQAARELHETNQRLTALIGASPLAIIMLDEAGNIRLWNSAAERIFGWSEEEVLGARLPFVPEAHQEEHRALCDRVLRGEALAGVETSRIRKNGSPVQVSISAAPLRSATGEIVGVMGVVADVTERLQIEAARREREAAERASLAKSEFLSRMSHELRTPMNAILGFTQLLTLDALDEEQRESVDQILMAGRHLLALIDEVLDLSRIEAGRMSLSLKAISVGETANGALNMIRPLAEQRRISIRMAPEPLPDLTVHADQQRLKQVLLNFLSNAVKYNRERGSVTLSVTGTCENWVRIAVRDDGRGIPEDKLERLFVPFERLDAPERGIEGTGLGLALSARLVEAMGGRIGVESCVGEGSTFWIEMPRAEGASPPVPTNEATQDTPVSQERGEATHTVLYIEDNTANLRLVERMLRRRPHIQLLAAMQGSLGLELAKEHRPDLILLDLNLPDLPGEAVLERVQETPELRGIPIVVISADARAARIEELLNGGAADYLSKPFEMDGFLEVIDAHCRRIDEA